MRSIQLCGLTKRFGDVVALAGVDLDIAPAESLVVLGPSGCGKSTMLRLIAGLDQPTDGDVQFDGSSQLEALPHERDVSIVFQNFALYPHLSAEENITLGLRFGLGMSKSDALERARQVARRMEIEPLLGRRPKAMSGGQRQRVALARALARESGIVLLDEPLSGLDAQLRATLRVEIAALLRSTGATVIHVTHDQIDAMAMADRVAVMRDGLIQQLGTPEAIYREPVNEFVARFVGTPPMNLFEADMRGGRIHTDAFGCVGFTELDDGSAVLGVRPEHLQLGNDGLHGLGVVQAVELAGSDWLIYIRVGKELVALRSTNRTPPRVGDTVPMSVATEHVHCFAGHDRRRTTTGWTLQSVPQDATSPTSSAVAR